MFIHSFSWTKSSWIHFSLFAWESLGNFLPDASQWNLLSSLHWSHNCYQISPLILTSRNGKTDVGTKPGIHCFLLSPIFNPENDFFGIHPNRGLLYHCHITFNLYNYANSFFLQNVCMIYFIKRYLQFVLVLISPIVYLNLSGEFVHFKISQDFHLTAHFRTRPVF